MQKWIGSIDFASMCFLVIVTTLQRLLQKYAKPYLCGKDSFEGAHSTNVIFSVIEMLLLYR